MEHNLEVVFTSLNFSEADLAANRSGRLSNHQIKQIKRQRFPWIGLIFILMLSCTGFLLVRLIGMPAQVQDLLRTFSLLTMLPAIYATFRLIQLQHILRRGNVAVVQGIVQKSKVPAITGDKVSINAIVHPRGYVHEYLVHVQEASFKVSEDKFYLFIDGLSYCIYYLPTTMSILSYDLCNQKS